MGGETTVANIRILCQRHNLLAARQAFGEKLMRRYGRGRARPPSTQGSAHLPPCRAIPLDFGVDPAVCT
jgi:hypothetical protein